MTELATLIFQIIEQTRTRYSNRPALIGLSGAQGSGKTYVCRLLEAANRPRFAHFSLDDVYLTKAERDAKARDVHPLFATRGPPGTHDLQLADRTLDRLLTPPPLEGEGARGWGESRAPLDVQQDAMRSVITPSPAPPSRGREFETHLPRFDKRTDDRAPESEWPIFKGKPEAILFDGWCVGALPDELGAAPINALEANEDADGRWRDAVRATLATDYQAFFDRFDAIVYLQAPTWEIVRAWRGQQEEQTLGRKLTAGEEAKLDRFLMFYERITKSMMAGGHSATHVVKLDEGRGVLRTSGGT